MRKSIYYIMAIAAGAASLGGVAILNNTVATTENNTTTNILATTNEIENVLNSNSSLSSKDEAVYLIADANGKVNKTFVANTLYTGNNVAPVEMVVTYELNGTEIAVTELSGKSGHIKIKYTYRSLNSYQGKLIPFIAATGLKLDGAKFTNVKISNGKIVSEAGDFVIVGYGVPGLNENFGAEIFPESFEIEADVSDFALGTTYTLFSNEMIAELDTTKLNSADAIINSINQLGEGLDQIVTGSKDLAEGLKTLTEKSGELVAGIKQLDNGLNQLAENNGAIVYGATATFDGLVAQANQKLNDSIANNTLITSAIQLVGENYGLSLPLNLTRENYSETFEKLIALIDGFNEESLSALGLSFNEEILAVIQGAKTELSSGKAALDSYNEFYNGILTYTAGVKTAAAGATEIATSMPALISGETELYNGAVKLSDGISTFKTSGIDKLVDFANSEGSNFVYNARKSVDAARSYHAFSNTNAKTVKFIVKTAGI